MTTEYRQRLVIRVSNSGLSFSTVDQEGVIYEPYPLKNGMSVAANMREALRTVPLLKVQYLRVVVLVDSPVLMTPTELFRKDDCEMQYRFTFTGQEPQAVLHAVVPDLNAVAVFAIAKDMRTVLTDQYEHALDFQPVMTSVWRHLYQKSFTGPRQKLYGYFHDRRMEVFAFAQNRFKFCNSYPVARTASDALYFLLSVWKQIGLDPREDELHLCGDMPEKELLTSEAGKYVKRIFTGNPSGEFNRAQVTQIEGMPYDLMLFYLKR